MNEPFECAPEAVIEEVRRVLHDAGVAPERATPRKVRVVADVIYMAGQQREREQSLALLARNGQSDEESDEDASRDVLTVAEEGGGHVRSQ